MARGVLQANGEMLMEKPLREFEDPVRTLDARPQVPRGSNGHSENVAGYGVKIHVQLVTLRIDTEV